MCAYRRPRVCETTETTRWSFVTTGTTQSRMMVVPRKAANNAMYAVCQGLQWRQLQGQRLRNAAGGRVGHSCRCCVVCVWCDTQCGGMRKTCASSMMISFKSDRRHASTTSFLLLPPPPLAALLTTPSAPQRHKQPWHQLQLHQRHRPGHALRPSCTSSPITCPPSTGPSTAAWCSIMEVSSGLGCAGHSSRHLRTLASASTP